MWMRNRTSPPIRGTSPSMSYDIEIPNWWLSSKFKKEKKEFFYRMKIAFEELSLDKNLIFTDQIFSEMFETYISQCLKNKKKFRKFFYKIFVSIFPVKIIGFIKSILFYKSEFVSKDIYINHNELRKILSVIKNSDILN